MGEKKEFNEVVAERAVKNDSPARAQETLRSDVSHRVVIKSTSRPLAATRIHRPS